MIGMGEFRSDLRFALRMLVKDRRFTVAAIVALGLGIGVTTTVFGLINIAMIRDVPFPEPDRLLAVRLRDARGQATGLSYADYRDWLDRAASVEGIAAETGGASTLAEEGRAPERFRNSFVSASLFGLLRTPPVIGRDFRPEDDQPGAPAVVMLGHGVWQSRFGGDPAVVGRAVRVDDRPAVIIGVMPPGFSYPHIVQIWQPLSQAPGVAAAPRDARRLGAVARLKDGIDLPQARAEFETIARTLARDHPATNGGTSAAIDRLKDLRPDVPKPILWALGGAVGFVMLICCANLASLLLARSVNRARDFAIRASLGATRPRLLRQLLIECALLAGLGGALGLALSLWGLEQVVIAFSPIDPGMDLARPYWVDSTPDAATFLFVGGLCVFTTFAFGLLPAWHLSAANAHEILKASGRGGSTTGARRWTSVLLVAELALTLVLLTGAGLLWRGFIDHYQRDIVIDPAGVVTMRLTLPSQKYPTPERRRSFLEQLDERLSSIPAFTSVSMGTHLPLDFGGAARELTIDGATLAPDEKPPIVTLVTTGNRYFETLSLPIVRGRSFEPGDAAAGREGVIVDQQLAERFLGAADPIGRRIRFTPASPGPPAAVPAGSGPGPWYTIVGIAKTVPQTGPPALVRPMAYAPLRADPSPGGLVVVLVKGDLAAATTALREEVRLLDPSLPLFAIETLDAAVARQRFPVRMIGTWFSVLALVALVIATVGLFSLTAHAVAQRVHEIGVRMAVGAQASQVVWLFLRRAVIQLVIGLALGLAGAFSVGGLLGAFLGGVSPRDFLTIAVVTTLLAAIAIASSLLPARRASRVDPAVTLRAE